MRITNITRLKNVRGVGGRVSRCDYGLHSSKKYIMGLRRMMENQL